MSLRKGLGERGETAVGALKVGGTGCASDPRQIPEEREHGQTPAPPWPLKAPACSRQTAVGWEYGGSVKPH